MIWQSRRLLLTPIIIAAGGGMSSAREAPDWSQVGALFAERCVICHSGADAPLGLRLDSYEGAMTGSQDGPVLIPGDPPGSELIRRVRGESLPQMPLVGEPLSDDEIAMIESWIEAGLPEGSVAAAEPVPEDDGATDTQSETQPEVLAGAAPAEEPETPAPERAEADLPGPGELVTFAHVEPIFLRRCAVCHSDANPDGPPEGLQLDSYEHILEGGEELVLIPGHPQASEIVQYIDGTERPRMPLGGPPLSEDQIRLIRQWIEQGAPNAEGVRAPTSVARGMREDDEDEDDEEDEDDD